MAQESVRVSTPLEDDLIQGLHVGDRVLISGQVYTARDAAHHRLIDAINAGEKLPIPLVKQIIYYVGPSPSQPGQIIGAAGPTTSSRMDPYTPKLIEQGLRGMIGKGKRDAAVRDSLAAHHAVYFAAVGGAAALIAQSIKAVELIAYEDLGTEAIRLLTIEDFPAVVANDIYGADLYEQGKISFQRYGRGS
jgi:fumarate hydratase subunit beta